MEKNKIYNNLYKTNISIDIKTKLTIIGYITEVVDNNFSSLRYDIFFSEDNKKVPIPMISRKDIFIFLKKLEKLIKNPVEEEVIELALTKFTISYKSDFYTITIRDSMFFIDKITIKCIYDYLNSLYNNLDLITIQLLRKKKSNSYNKKPSTKPKKSEPVFDEIEIEEDEESNIPDDSDGFFNNIF